MNTPINIEKLRAGDKETLDALFSELIPIITDSVHEICHTGQYNMDVDDTVADVIYQLLRVPDRLADIAEAGNLKAYCSVLARNKAMHVLQRKRKSAAAVADYENELAKYEARIPVLGYDSEAISNALVNLSEVERQIISLRFIQGLSLKQIAEILNTSTGSTYLRLHRSLGNLRQAIGESKQEPRR